MKDKMGSSTGAGEMKDKMKDKMGGSTERGEMKDKMKDKMGEGAGEMKDKMKDKMGSSTGAGEMKDKMKDKMGGSTGAGEMKDKMKDKMGGEKRERPKPPNVDKAKMEEALAKRKSCKAIIDKAVGEATGEVDKAAVQAALEAAGCSKDQAKTMGAEVQAAAGKAAADIMAKCAKGKEAECRKEAMEKIKAATGSKGGKGEMTKVLAEGAKTKANEVMKTCMEGCVTCKDD